MNPVLRLRMVNVLVLGACDRPAQVFSPKGLETLGTTVVTPLQPQVEHSDCDTLVRVVTEAFVATHNGWSVDEVLLHNGRNTRFLNQCRQYLPNATAFDCNWMLLNLRKSGDLSSVVVTKRRRDNHDGYLHADEIAARFMQDRYGLNMDRVLCSPPRRLEFDQIALQILSAQNHDLAYQLRKTALRLRVSQHLNQTDRKALASYLWEKGICQIQVELHVFAAESKAKHVSVWRAYESELIRSRQPRFNVRP